MTFPLYVTKMWKGENPVCLQLKSGQELCFPNQAEMLKWCSQNPTAYKTRPDLTPRRFGYFTDRGVFVDTTPTTPTTTITPPIPSPMPEPAPITAEPIIYGQEPQPTMETPKEAQPNPIWWLPLIAIVIIVIVCLLQRKKKRVRW